MLNILVMGAGAVGCFVGGSLAAHNHRVTLVGRPALMEKIATDGLILQWPGQPAQTVWPNTITTVATPGDPYDFVLLTVKTPDTEAAVEELGGLALNSAKTYFVSLQNGIGNEENLAASFSREQVIGGTITIPISMPEPGLVEVRKAKGGVGLAPMGLSQPVQRLADSLNQAGLTTATYQDYRAVKWSKLLLNIVNNASCAILNLPPTQIIAHPGLFNLEINALKEGLDVMKAQGITTVKLPGYPVNWLARLLGADWLPRPVIRAILRPFMLSGRGSKMPSLQIDLAAGRPTSEIGALNGAIVQAGQRVGISTPVNQALTDILSGLVSGRLSWPDYQNRPEKLLEAVAISK